MARTPIHPLGALAITLLLVPAARAEEGTAVVLPTLSGGTIALLESGERLHTVEDWRPELGRRVRYRGVLRYHEGSDLDLVEARLPGARPVFRLGTVDTSQGEWTVIVDTGERLGAGARVWLSHRVYVKGVQAQDGSVDWRGFDAWKVLLDDGREAMLRERPTAGSPLPPHELARLSAELATARPDRLEVRTLRLVMHGLDTPEPGGAELVTEAAFRDLASPRSLAVMRRMRDRFRRDRPARERHVVHWASEAGPYGALTVAARVFDEQLRSERWAPRVEVEGTFDERSAYVTRIISPPLVEVRGQMVGYRLRAEDGARYRLACAEREGRHVAVRGHVFEDARGERVLVPQWMLATVPVEVPAYAPEAFLGVRALRPTGATVPANRPLWVGPFGDDGCAVTLGTPNRVRLRGYLLRGLDGHDAGLVSDDLTAALGQRPAWIDFGFDDPATIRAALGPAPVAGVGLSGVVDGVGQ